MTVPYSTDTARKTYREIGELGSPITPPYVSRVPNGTGVAAAARKGWRNAVTLRHPVERARLHTVGETPGAVLKELLQTGLSSTMWGTRLRVPTTLWMIFDVTTTERCGH